MAVIGGGYIGLEFAGIYNNYGSEVHVVFRQVGLSLFCQCSCSILAAACDHYAPAVAAAAAQ